MVTPQTRSSRSTATRLAELEDAGQYFMAAVVAFALETAILRYVLVEFGEDNGGELEIPDSVNMGELIDAPNEIDVLNSRFISGRTPTKRGPRRRTYPVAGGSPA